jgi:copper homeostasis protein
MVEVCCFDLESCIRAENEGADRIELCSNQGEGGISPSYGLLKSYKKYLKIPAYVMIRPRGGHFVFSTFEKNQMLYDAKKVKDMGFEGLVTGALNKNGTVDISFLEQLLSLDLDLKMTFHRAIDHSSDPLETLEICKKHGFENILSSGSREFAEEGIQNLISMKKKTGGLLNILVGSGLNATNLELFYNEGFRYFHLSASEINKRDDTYYKNPFFRDTEYEFKQVNISKLALFIKTLKNLELKL